MSKWYTFNRPVFALLLVPLIFLMVMLIYGVVQEFNFVVILMSLITLLFMTPIVFLSFLRRMRIGEEEVEWITYNNRKSIPLTEINHYGVIKYRSFRFIFLSRADENPFETAGSKIVPTDDTFLVQYRKGAWRFVKSMVKRHHPELKPLNLVHQ